jgi:hypothetical protein
VLSGEGQQRESTASLFPENPGFLFWGAMSAGIGGLKCFSFHPAILPRPPPSTEDGFAGRLQNNSLFRQALRPCVPN